MASSTLAPLPYFAMVWSNVALSQFLSYTSPSLRFPTFNVASLAHLAGRPGRRLPPHRSKWCSYILMYSVTCFSTSARLVPEGFGFSYTTILTESLVTPGEVAPPLSAPVGNAATHSGANTDGN